MEAEKEIKSFLNEWKPRIDREMEKCFPRKADKKWTEKVFGKPLFEFDEESINKSLNEPIWEFLDRGGKRWRPVLMLLVNEAFGGNPEKILEFACLPEMVHNGTIMVDDVEDDSDLRRGTPCTHKIYGTDIAINAGNMLYFAPLLPLTESGLSEKKKNRAFEIYVQALLELSVGQGLDIYWHKGKKEPSEKEYLQMVAFKTGTLARFSAKLGAVLADAEKKEAEAAGKFASMIGVGFQIQDDILNIKPTGEWGKEFGDDINEGKRTLMVIHSFANAEKKDAERLKEILGMHTKDEKLIKEAVSLIEKTASIDYAREKAKELVKGAWKEIEPLLKESKAKKKLRAFADYLVERDC